MLRTCRPGTAFGIPSFQAVRHSTVVSTGPTLAQTPLLAANEVLVDRFDDLLPACPLFGGVQFGGLANQEGGCEDLGLLEVHLEGELLYISQAAKGEGLGASPCSLEDCHGTRSDKVGQNDRADYDTRRLCNDMHVPCILNTVPVCCPGVRLLTAWGGSHNPAVRRSRCREYE